MTGRALLITGLIMLGLVGAVAWTDPEINDWVRQLFHQDTATVITNGQDSLLVEEPKNGPIRTRPNPRQEVLSPAPQPFRLYYLDISSIGDRSQLLDSLERGLQETDWQSYLFLTNGAQTRVGMDSLSNLAVLEGISFLNVDIPVLKADAATLLADTELIARLTQAPSGDLRFFLSRDIYHLSGEVLIESILTPLRKLQPACQVTIYVEGALPEKILSDPTIQILVLPPTG